MVNVLFHLDRKGDYYFNNILMMVFLVNVMALCTFVIPLEDTSGRLGLVSSCFLAVLAYRYIINEILPRKAYLTAADKYITFACVFLILICVQTDMMAGVFLSLAWVTWNVYLWCLWKWSKREPWHRVYSNNAEPYAPVEECSACGLRWLAKQATHTDPKGTQCCPDKDCGAQQDQVRKIYLTPKQLPEPFVPPQPSKKPSETTPVRYFVERPRIYEALELRDNEKRLLGKGVLQAVANVNDIIAPKLIGMEVTKQTEIDKLMVESLDGSQNEWGWSKAKLGANAILAVSMAVCRAGAAASRMPLYKYIARISGKPYDSFVMPVPSFNVINGGSHAGNRLACQEFMILPVGASSFREAMCIGAEVYHNLKSVIKKKYGQDACNVGDEGGFAPSVQDNNEALDVLMEAIEKSGHAGKVKIGTDVAASEFYSSETKKYDLDFKNPSSPDSMKKTADEMIAYYKDWIGKYPFVSIEDPFDQDDWDAYSKFQADVGDSIQSLGCFAGGPLR
eukprot:s204_g39.t2